MERELIGRLPPGESGKDGRMRVEYGARADGMTGGSGDVVAGEAKIGICSGHFSISDIELTFNIDRGSPRLLLCFSHRQLTLLASPTEAVSTSDGSAPTVRFVTCAECAADRSLRARLQRLPRTVVPAHTRRPAFNIVRASHELQLSE